MDMPVKILICRLLGPALALALLAPAPAAAQNIRFDFTEQSLTALSNNETRRSRMCVANTAKLAKLREGKNRIEADAAEARELGRPDLARTFERDLGALEREIAEVQDDLQLCANAFFVKPIVANLCGQLGEAGGSLCESFRESEAAENPDPRFADDLQKLVTLQAAVPWAMREAPELTSPDGRQIRATVRRGNLQVSYRIGAHGFVIADPPEEQNQQLVQSLKNVNATHGIDLTREGYVYAPFIEVNAFGGVGLAGETHQALVGIKGEEPFVQLTPPAPVSHETGVASHTLPLTFEAWQRLPQFDMIGVVGTRRVPGGEGEEPQDRYLYFLGLETQGLKPLLDELRDYYLGF